MGPFDIVPGEGTGGGYEIRTREGLPPTRFPILPVSVRASSDMFRAWSLPRSPEWLNGREPWRMRLRLRLRGASRRAARPPQGRGPGVPDVRPLSLGRTTPCTASGVTLRRPSSSSPGSRSLSTSSPTASHWLQQSEDRRLHGDGHSGQNPSGVALQLTRHGGLQERRVIRAHTASELHIREGRASPLSAWPTHGPQASESRFLMLMSTTHKVSTTRPCEPGDSLRRFKP